MSSSSAKNRLPDSGNQILYQVIGEKILARLYKQQQEIVPKCF